MLLRPSSRVFLSLSFSEISFLSLSTVARSFAVFFACFIEEQQPLFLHCQNLF